MTIGNSYISLMQKNAAFSRVRYSVAIAMCLFISPFFIGESSARTSKIYGRINITLWMYPFTVEDSYAQKKYSHTHLNSLASNKPYARYINIIRKTPLRLNSRHVTSTQLHLQIHICHTRHTALGKSVQTVRAKSIDIYFFRVRLGLINRFMCSLEMRVSLQK